VFYDQVEFGMSKKQKLELTWIGKNETPRLEPRILIEDKEKSFGDPDSKNMLIHGDNLLGLKALESRFSGKVKCVFIDPPYNTGSAFKQYDDGLEHSLWLSLMKERLIVIRKLLSEEGSIWITIDDNEAHYLKILCDEVYGRGNFVANVVWQKKSSPQPNAIWLSDSHDHILVFAKCKDKWRPNKLPRSEEQNAIYNHSDEHDGVHENGDIYGRGPWYPGDATASLRGGQRGAQFAKTGTSPNIYPITSPSGKIINPPAGSCWRFSKDRMDEMILENRITFGKSGGNRPCVKRFLAEYKDKGIVPMTAWHYSDVGENRVAASEVKKFNKSDPFTTPKPEKLLQRILHIASNEGDLILDSFLGSGTTAAVAHKMQREWIGIELGAHCTTHCLPRLRDVVEGESGGVSKAVNWNGGGGFKFYQLAPSLLKKNPFGQWVIHPEYNQDMLASAIAKHHGYTYSPSSELFWKHGYSTEKDFIFTTTQMVTARLLDVIHEQMKPEESLLICAKKFSKGIESRYPNIDISKVPNSLIGKCEFGRDDYSLNVNPEEEPNEDIFSLMNTEDGE
jgi:adenine-specific DNA-methyltransferase